MEIVNTYVRSDNRVIAYCRDKQGNPKIISYPRLLIEQKLGRQLKSDEDIHHIDGNPLNNDIANLEIIEHGKHQQLHNPFIAIHKNSLTVGAGFPRCTKHISATGREPRPPADFVRIFLCTAINIKIQWQLVKCAGNLFCGLPKDKVVILEI